MLQFGNQHRTQHPTDANAESSRSHAVFQVHHQVLYILPMSLDSLLYYIYHSFIVTKIKRDQNSQGVNFSSLNLVGIVLAIILVVKLIIYGILFWYCLSFSIHISLSE